MAELDQKLTIEKWKELFLLRWYWRVVIGLIGSVLLRLSYRLLVSPPSRVLWELSPGNKLTDKVTVSVADSPSIVIAIFTAGIAFVVWAIIGIKIFKFEGFGFKAEIPTPPGPLDAPSPPVPVPPVVEPPDAEQVAQAEPEEVAALHNDAEAHAQPPPAPVIQNYGQVGVDAFHTFLLRSSWNALKILKACQVAKEKNKPIQLREICALSGMSYDYAFGYFIASFSANIIAGVADPVTGQARIMDTQPTLVARIDEVIQGNLTVVPSLQEQKRQELAALHDYLARL